MIHLSDAAIQAGIIAGLEADNAAKDKSIAELEQSLADAVAVRDGTMGAERIAYVAALTAENEKLRKDAERYRLLLAYFFDEIDEAALGIDETVTYTKETFSELLSSAIAKENGNG